MALTLPRGLVDTDGQRHRDVTLAGADGWVERAVTTAVAETTPTPEVRHALLSGCVARIGGYVEPDPATVAMLSRGDLDVLGLWLRQTVIGDALSLVVRCPRPTCAALADVDLTVAELLPDVEEAEPEWFVADAGAHGRVVLRPVTGADEVTLAALDVPPQARTAALMARLIRSVQRYGDDAPPAEGVDADGWAVLPAALRHAALLALAERPAAPTTRMQVHCPTCGALIEIALDPLVVLARELRGGGDRLLIETHCLAFHYGWSEEQILSLPRARRWGYLSLLREELSGMPLTAGGRHGP